VPVFKVAHRSPHGGTKDPIISTELRAPPMAITKNDLIEMYGEDAVENFLTLFPPSRLHEMPEAYCGKYVNFNDFAEELDYPVDEDDGTYIYQNHHIFYSDF